MSLGLLLLLSALLSVLTGWVAAPRALAAEEVVLEVQPSTLEFVHANEHPRVVIVLRNDSLDTLRAPAIDTITPDRVTAFQVDSSSGLPSLTAPDLPPKGDLSWTFEIDQAGAEIQTGTVLFRVHYRAGDPGSPIRILVASLELKAGQAKATEDVLGSNIKTSLKSLDEGTPGVIFLVLTNKATFPVESSLTQIEPSPVQGGKPPAIKFTFREEKLKLPAGDTRVIRIDVSKQGPISPGQYIFLFRIQLTWTEGEETVNRSLFVDHSTSIGIFGESQLLSVLAIPTILFLPGFIFMAIVGALWKTKWLGGPNALGGAFELKSPIYYVVAITVSGIIIGLFRTIGTNFLQAYGPSDLVRLWIASSLIAILFSLILAWMIQTRVRDRTYSYDDDGITVLRKLHRHRLGLLLQRTTVEKPAGEEPDLRRAFLLEQLNGKKTIWVAPTLFVRWTGTEPDEYHERFERLASDRPAQRSRSKEMAELLEQAMGEGHISVEWDGGSRRSGPWPMVRKEEDDVLDPNLFVWD